MGGVGGGGGGCGVVFFFFFNDTATTEIYTLSLHDALPILYLVLYVAIALSYLNLPLLICLIVESILDLMT